METNRAGSKTLVAIRTSDEDMNAERAPCLVYLFTNQELLLSMFEKPETNALE